MSLVVLRPSCVTLVSGRWRHCLYNPPTFFVLTFRSFLQLSFSFFFFVFNSNVQRLGNLMRAWQSFSISGNSRARSWALGQIPWTDGSFSWKNYVTTSSERELLGNIFCPSFRNIMPIKAFHMGR